MNTTEAITRIMAAANAAALFGSPYDGADRAGAERLYRRLAGAVHPDRAGADGAGAMGRLNQLHDEWATMSADPGHASAAVEPYLQGRTRRFPLRARVAVAASVATYSTDSPTTFVDLARIEKGNAQAGQTAAVATRLAAAGLGAFAPTTLERGITGGHAWTAWGVPDALVTLRQVASAFPGGMDGRDWAWMARRILMVLAEAGLVHGGIGLDTVLIHPDQHGVVVTGWGCLDDSGAWPAPSGPRADVAALTDLFDAVLAPDERRQRAFARASRNLAPARFLTEYDLLLGHLYGPRRFRPLTLDRPTR